MCSEYIPKEPIIKESAEWINRTLTWLKSKQDPYGEDITDIIQILVETIDDIDGSLYRLSQAGNKGKENLELDSVKSLSTAKDKMLAVAKIITFRVVKKMVDQNGLQKYVDESDLEPSSEEIISEKPQKLPSKKQKKQEMEVLAPAPPMESVFSEAEALQTISAIKGNLIVIDLGLRNISSGLDYIIGARIKLPSGSEHEFKAIELSQSIPESGEKFVQSADVYIKTLKQKTSLMRHRRLVPLIDTIDLVLSRQTPVDSKTYQEIRVKYQGISSEYALIRHDFVKLLNASKSHESLVGQLEDIELPPEVESESKNAGAGVGGNIILHGIKYTDVVNRFVVKYAARPSYFEKFMTSIYELMQLLKSPFVDSAARIVEFRKCVKAFKSKIANIVNVIRSTAGKKSSPKEEFDRWDKIISAYNEFVDVYNDKIQTTLASRMSSLYHDLWERKSDALSPENVFSNRSYETAVRMARSSYHPSQFVMEKIPRVEQLLVDYSKDRKLWGMKKPKEVITTEEI